MNKDGTIEFKANKKQKQALRYLTDDTTTSLGYGGGAGGGKTFLGVFWVYSSADTYPGTRYFFGRNELKRLKQTTLTTFFKMVEEYGFPKTFNYNAQDGVIKLSNGSEILLLDLSYQPSDPLYQRFGSLELTGGFIDESGEVKSDCIDIIQTRIGRQKNKEYNIRPKLLETFNPDKGHVYSRFYKPYKNDTLESHIKFIPALVTDEPRIDPEYVKQLRKANEITRQRLLYGNFDYDDDPNKLFERDDIENMFGIHMADSGDKWLTVDVARYGRDHTVYGVWFGYQLIKVVSKPHTSMLEVTEDILNYEKEYKIPRAKIVIDEDGVGGGVVDSLKGCTGFVNGGRPDKTSEDMPNFENRKSQCYYKFAEMVEAGKVGIDETQFREVIIEELEQIKQRDADKDGKLKVTRKEDIIERIGRSPDLADMMMMRFVQVTRKYTQFAPMEYTPRTQRNPAY